MNIGNKHIFIISLLGALKLILSAFGISFFTNEQIDAIVNGISSLCVLSGLVANYFKGKKTKEENKKD
jgi:uncharacterized membrane protein